MRVDYEVVGPNRIKLNFVAQTRKDRELLTLLEAKLHFDSVFVRGASVSEKGKGGCLVVRELEMMEKRKGDVELG